MRLKIAARASASSLLQRPRAKSGFRRTKIFGAPLPSTDLPAHSLPARDVGDDAASWLVSSTLLDLEDTRLRLRTRALTQLCKTDREKALAVYAFVKRMPFSRPVKLRPRTAREVLDMGKGDSPDKATLLVALLRLAGIAARMQFVKYRGEVMRGLMPRPFSNWRPVVQALIAGHWVATDTYIFDAVYMAAARQRLKDQGWDRGYGIDRDGQGIWNGLEGAWTLGLPPGQDPMALQVRGCWHDPDGFLASDVFRSEHRTFARRMHWNIVAPWMARAIRELREDGRSFPPATPSHEAT